MGKFIIHVGERKMKQSSDILLTNYSLRFDRATTAAPTFFKPLLSFDELYVDGGIVASNPTAVAVHEARTVFPDVSVSL